MRNLLLKRPCVRSFSKPRRVGSLFDTKTLYEKSVIKALLCESFLGAVSLPCHLVVINNRTTSWFLISCNCWNISVKGTDILVDVV
jgi:hypothetical protein